MNTADVADHLATLRRIGGEPAHIEAKRATGGLPKSLRETLSAFSNTDGGIVLLGVDEASGFQTVPLEDPATLRDDLVQMSRDDMVPALMITTEILQVDDHIVVVAEVPPMSTDRRPVYVKAQGVANGSYLRGGDGDRHMTEAEIALVISSRSQPTYDREAVPGTTVADLVQDALSRTLLRIRAGSPRLGQSDDATVLHRLGITSSDEPDAPLTIAGLLAFGQFPQQYFPQLMVSAVVHAPTSDTSTRFLDIQTVRGSIPEMVDATISMIARNLPVRAIISEHGGRFDEIEYPLEGVREAVVNALMHRDYSPVTRGTQVQVDLFPDRLEVRSPGGLYGGVGIDDLGEEGISSSRNATLASLLSDTYLPSSTELVAENRSSGIPAMLNAARRRGLPRPTFLSSVTSFVVTMNRSELLSPAVRAWMAALDAQLPSNAHHIALAMLHAGPLTNAMLRQWGVDRVEASQVLRDLVDQGLAIKEGGRRYAQYVLDPAAGGRHEEPNLFHDLFSYSEETPVGVSEALRAVGDASAAELQNLTGLSRTAVLRQLNTLIATGEATASGAPRSPQRRYNWVGVKKPQH